MPMTSLPLRAAGIAWEEYVHSEEHLPAEGAAETYSTERRQELTWAWIGVGWENSERRMSAISSSSNPKWAKDTHGLGEEKPVTWREGEAA